MTLQDEIEFLGTHMANLSNSSQSMSQPNDMPEFLNQMTMDTTTGFIDQTVLNNDVGINCIEGFFTNPEEVLVNHPWFQNMDHYYYAPQH